MQILIYVGKKNEKICWHENIFYLYNLKTKYDKLKNKMKKIE